MILIVNQTKYGQIMAVNFTIVEWNHDYEIIIQKCIQQTMNKNLLRLKDSLES